MDELNLIQKLAKIRGMSGVVLKEKEGYDKFKYKYADITTILAQITTGMKKYGVSLIPYIVPGTTEINPVTMQDTKFDKTGKSYVKTSTEILVKTQMCFKWVNDDNPGDFVEVPWFMVGSHSDPSQAFGSGLTYTLRQFLTSYFQIAQTEYDVDAYRSKQKVAEEAEDREIAAGIVEKFDGLLRHFIATNPDRTNDVKKFVSGFVKNANYSSIKDPVQAAKLLEGFRDAYLVGDTPNPKDKGRE